MTQNNENLVLCEEANTNRNNPYCKCIFSFYKLELDRMVCCKKFDYSSRNSFQYKLNKKRSLVIIASLDDSERSISLSFYKIDEVNDIGEAVQSPKPQDLNTRIKIEKGKESINEFSMELSVDERKLCIMVEGGEGDQYYCDAHFYQCNFTPGNGLTLVKMFSMDASVIGVVKVDPVVFNMSGDKIAMLTKNGFLVYSLVNQSVIAKHSLKDFEFHEIEWSYDLEKGEILVDFDYTANEICVFGFNSIEKTSKLLNTIHISTFVEELSEFEAWNSGIKISTGTSFIIFGDEDVYLVDPFTGQLVQKITPPKDWDNVFVDFFCLNWFSSEILILYQGEKESFYGKVCKLKTGCVESLLQSAIKIVLLNYSVNDLIGMNLPKTVKRYFID
uniref:Uncharacterized protein n=1 Tax=Clytia hemisphaerica TaxID=252671 RepID=A0A7M5WSF8_9CNID